jgi:RNA polymerase sigma factor (sigma-70 family)
MQRIIIAEEKLLEAIRIKSRVGAVALYDMYSNTLYGVITRIVKNKEMAEDVLQETFIKIWDSFGKYDASKGRFFTWMSCIARNMAKDALRSRQYHEYLNTACIDDHAERIDRDNRVNFNTDTVGLKLWLVHLKKAQKDILELIYFKGYTQTEVACKLNIPLGTVKGRCRKGISVLRSIYNQGDSSEHHLRYG